MKEQDGIWDDQPLGTDVDWLANLNESSVCGRICTTCTFDESVIDFEPYVDARGRGGTRCTGCGTAFDEKGLRRDGA